MQKKPDKWLMMAYILFIFTSVFTRHLYSQSKWSYIVTAITVTSWVLVISDSLAAAAEFIQEIVIATKPKLESYLFQLRHNRSINNRLDSLLKDEYGNDTGKTIGQTLDGMEKSTLASITTLKKQEKTQKWFEVLSYFFMLLGFILFFCVLLFDPIFSFFNSKLDGMTLLAFGTILATQFCIDTLKEHVQNNKNTLDNLNQSMKLLNQSYKAEASDNAD